MYKISIEQIQKLREETGLSITECKKALEDTNGDVEKAKVRLQKLGKQIAEKKQARETGEGIVEAYSHPTGKLGVVVDVRCETDFVSRSDDFKNFCHEVALQVASMNPASVEALLKQPYIRDPSKQIEDVLNQIIAKLGENVVIKRFSRFEI